MAIWEGAYNSANKTLTFDEENFTLTSGFKGPARPLSPMLKLNIFEWEAVPQYGGKSVGWEVSCVSLGRAEIWGQEREGGGGRNGRHGGLGFPSPFAAFVVWFVFN